MAQKRFSDHSLTKDESDSSTSKKPRHEAPRPKRTSTMSGPRSSFQPVIRRNRSAAEPAPGGSSNSQLSRLLTIEDRSTRKAKNQVQKPKPKPRPNPDDPSSLHDVPSIPQVQLPDSRPPPKVLHGDIEPHNVDDLNEAMPASMDENMHESTRKRSYGNKVC